MADQASTPPDTASEAGDEVAASGTHDPVEAHVDEPGADAIVAEAAGAVPEAAETVDADRDAGDDSLLSELARAMHTAATSQYQRLNTDLERRRAEQVESIAARTDADIETLKADSETDIGSIELWAKAEIEKIKLERLRRIDARREQLAAQLERQDTIKEREIFAIEIAIDAHRNEVEQFFGRLERETDPAAIARIASTMPSFPSLPDVAEQARRGAAAEFASLEQAVVAPATESTATEAPAATATEAPKARAATTAATAAKAEAETETAGSSANLEGAATVSETRLKGVMDPTATHGEAEPTQPWEAPYAVSVAAGTGAAEEEPAPVSVGSTLLRTVRSIRPMAGRHDKDSGEGDASR